MPSKLLALFFALCLICVPAWDHALGASVDITIHPDKTAYLGNEIAQLAIDITNNTTATVRNLRIQNLVPTGLAYVNPSEANRTIAALAPGQTTQHVIRLRVANDAMTGVNVPKTGDTASPVLWSLLLLASCVLMGWLGRRGTARKDV